MNCARPKPAPATPSMGRESVIHANADLVEGVTEAEAEAPPEGFARYACLVPLLSRMMIMMMIMMIMIMMIMMIDPRGYIWAHASPSSAQRHGKGVLAFRVVKSAPEREA